MKKLLILDNGTISAYRFRKELIAAFASSGWQVTVSAPDDGFAKELAALGAAYINTPIERHGTNPVRDYSLMRHYRKLIGGIRPDIILTYTIKPNIYGNLAARRYNMPVISVVTGLGETFIKKNIVSLIVSALYRAALRHTVRVVFLNREDMTDMCRVAPISNREYLLAGGEGVSLDEFPAMDYPGGDGASFLYVGRITRSKGITELIEASRRLRGESAGPFAVTLIGYHEGDIEEEVGSAVRDGIIHYAGFQKDIRPYVRGSHCVVLPSYKEGLPISLLEAAASARPLISTDISGSREIVKDSVNGFLCRTHDPDSLYECMKRFIALPHEQKKMMGLESRRIAAEGFGRQAAVSAMLALVEGHGARLT